MSKQKRLWPLAVIVGVWMLFIFPYWGKGLVPFPSAYLVNFFPPWNATYGMPVKNNAMPDVITQIYPWKKLTIDSWKNGEIPLWNPFSFSGTAHAANYQSAVFSPFNLLFFILPHIDAWSVMILLQPILAGLGMYLFLTTLRVSRTGRVLGSLAFMFCGFMTVWMAYGTLVYAVLFLPYALFAIEKHMEQSAWAASLLSILIALSFLSGHFQISLYVLVFIALYVLYMITTTRHKKRAAVLVPAIFFGLCLSGIQLLPAYSAYQESVRSGLFLKGEIIPWNYLVTLFAPDFYGNPVTRNDWFGHYAEWAGYVGVVPFLFASISLIFGSGHVRMVSFFGITGATLLLFALPTPLNDAMYALHIPVLSTSAASRIIVLVSFSLCVLAGIGTDVVVSLWQQKRVRSVTIWMFVIGVGIFSLWGWLLLVKPMAAGRLHVAVRNSILPTTLVCAAVFAVFAGFFVPKRFRSFVLGIFVLLTAFDMYRYAAKWMPFDPREYVYPEIPIVSHAMVLTKDSRARVFGNIGGEMGNFFQIPLIEGYDAVYKARYGEFIRSIDTGELLMPERSVAQFPKNGMYSTDAFNFLNVRYVLHKISDGRQGWAFPFWSYPQFQRVYENETYEVYENTDVYPRAYLASRYMLKTTPEDILAALYAEDIDRRETIILEKEPDIVPATGSGYATITRYDNTRVEINTESEVAKLLFLSDVYDDGWHASVDGRKVPVYRANYTFRAIAVPKGRHTVRMWYMPQSFLVGLIASGFGTLGCIWLWYIGRHRRRYL